MIVQSSKFGVQNIERPTLTPSASLRTGPTLSLRARGTDSNAGRGSASPLQISCLSMLIMAVSFLFAACGGGGGGGGGSTSPSTTISFSGTNPGSNSVYMAQNSSSSSGDILAIDVKMNNLSSNVYGAAFDVDFDSTKMTYNSYVAGSFLENGGNTVNYQVGLQSGNSGKLVIGISRQGAVSGVSGSGTLVTLKFRVTGNSSDAFSNYELRDSNNQAISGISWYGGTVSVL